MRRNCILLSLLLMAGVCFSVDYNDLMPKDNDIAGWSRTDNPKTFKKSDLYGYINGGAEIFLEFGFERLTVQKYKKGGDEFSVEIYEMSDPAAAVGNYLMKCGREQRDAAFSARHTLGRYQLMFQRNRFFVLIHNLHGKKKLVPDLIRFGQEIASRLPADTTRDLFKILPPVDLVQGSQRLIRGPYALQSIYTLGDGDILLLKGETTAVSADYKDPQGETFSVIMAEYSSQAASAEAFQYLSDNLDRDIIVIEKNHHRIVFKDYAHRTGVIMREKNRITIKVNLNCL